FGPGQDRAKAGLDVDAGAHVGIEGFDAIVEARVRRPASMSTASATAEVRVSSWAASQLSSRKSWVVLGWPPRLSARGRRRDGGEREVGADLVIGEVELGGDFGRGVSGQLPGHHLPLARWQRGQRGDEFVAEVPRIRGYGPEQRAGGDRLGCEFFVEADGFA